MMLNEIASRWVFCSRRALAQSCGVLRQKRPTLLKASFQRMGLFVFVELRSPVKPGMTCGTDMTMLFPDALSRKVQIVNKIGLQFQQNRLKVNTDIVLYQVLFCSKSRKSYLLIFVLIFS